MRQKNFRARTEIDPALSVLRTEVFTTQLPIKIIWKDLMLLFNEKISSHAIVNVQYSATKEFLFKFYFLFKTLLFIKFIILTLVFI